MVEPRHGSGENGATEAPQRSPHDADERRRRLALCRGGGFGFARNWPERASSRTGAFGRLRGLDLNQRPSGYENVK
jgi:hypothetical protein